jgi:hypothetical protein
MTDLYFQRQSDLHFEEFTRAGGTQDDDDDRDDENADENEIPVGDIEEGTEAPEEFEVDEEDELGHPEDDDADDIDDDLDDDADDDLDEDVDK